MRPEIVFDEEKHKYTVNGKIFPSVTTILGAVVPKELGWWGMQVGCEGVATMIREGWRPKAPIESCTGEGLVAELKERKLTTLDKRNKRAAAGTDIHKALELYVKEGTLPDLREFDPEERLRVQALAGWLVKTEPEFLSVEVQTASLEFQYAGTFDLRAKIKGQTVLIDLKTTKRVYPESHFPQIAAYEHAEVECGEDPTDYQAILHLPPDGEAQLVRSPDTFETFEALWTVYGYNQLRKEAMRKRRGKKIG